VGRLTDLVRVGLTLILDPPRPPSRREQWLAMEQRFGLIDGEVDGLRTSHVTGAREWLLESRGNPMGFQQFKVEAAEAGLLLSQMLQRHDDEDPIDEWLDAVLEHAHPERDLRITGRDPHRGMSRSASIPRMVETSKQLCAKLAADPRW
jgi:hypothetical protein